MIGVAIVGPVRSLCESLALFLGAHPDIEILSTEGTEGDMGRLRALLPDVVTVAYSRGALDWVRRFTATAPQLRVVLIGTPERDDEIIDFAEAGVSGFVTDEASLANVVDAIEGVRRGELIAPPHVGGIIQRGLAAASPRLGVAARERLTRREIEILELIAEGLPDKAIAQRLVIGVHTVRNHVHNLLQKLGVNNRIEAALWARRHGVGRT